MKDPPPPYTESTGGPRAQPPSTPLNNGKTTISTTQGGGDEIDSLFGEDERTLDEILEGLDVDEGDDQWSAEAQGADESERVAALLEKLQKDSASQPAGDEPRDDKDDDEAADDSDGDEMSRQVENVIARAMDEVNLEQQDSTEPSRPTDHGAGSGGKADFHKQGDDDLVLPTVPRDTDDKDETRKSRNKPEKASDEDRVGGEAVFSLPTVPTALQDPVPSSKDEFEDDIAKRMAALKGLGSDAVQFDDFGLPAVPTFQPEDRPVKGVVKKTGYTDEDQKTWCIVCLEDATVRCLGCDDDVYCARCWKEMHIGPSAGYDERGHQWVNFSRDKTRGDQRRS